MLIDKAGLFSDFESAQSNSSSSRSRLRAHPCGLHRRVQTRWGMCILFLLVCLPGALVAQSALISPAPGSTLAGPSATFTWSATSGATAYSVMVGSTGAGSTNLGGTGVTLATSATFTGLPTHGETIYVQLATEIHSAWVRTNYTFTAVSQPVLKAPQPGGTLTAATATFSWKAVPGADSYELWLGSTGVGSNNLWISAKTAGNSLTSGALPVHGETIYARLFTDFAGTMVHSDYTYTAATLSGSSLTSPAAGSVLTGPKLTFTWKPVNGATEYALAVGSTGAGSTNLENTGWIKTTSWPMTNLPTNGETLYVRLTTNFNGTLVCSDYTLTAATITPAALISPSPGSVLIATNVTFKWTPGSGNSNYQLWLGLNGPGSSNLYNSGLTTATSVTATKLPATGKTIYARLMSESDGAWKYTDYTFTAETVTPAVLISPAPGSTLAGAEATFAWSPGSGNGDYQLWLGLSGPGSSNLYNSGSTPSTSATATKLPTSGKTVYARLMSESGGVWKYTDYTYKEASPIPALSSLTCGKSSFIGAGSDACEATLTIAAPAGGFVVSLSSNNAAVSVPATVTIQENATSATFTATVNSVASAQAVALSASAAGVSRSFSVTLTAAVSALAMSASNLAFGNVTINSPATQSLTLTSTGTVPVTIKSTAVAGSGFQVSGGAFPVTLQPAQAVTVNVQFDPAAPAPADGQLTIASDSSSSETAVVGLSGTGTVPAASFNYTGSTLANTITPSDPSSPISNKFFGMSILDIIYGTTPFPAFQVSTLRLWDVTPWATLEPSSGNFDWSKMDGAITAAQQSGVKDFIFTFGHVPQWAALHPNDPCSGGGEGTGTCSAPDMTAFDEFATQTVQRYCGKVEYYETWNEANATQFWDGTNAQLLTVAQHLYQIAKDPANCGCTNGTCSPNGGINPNKVLMPSISDINSTTIAWLQSYLGTAGAQYPYADIAAFHGYGATNPEDIVTQVQTFRTTIAAYGLSNIELWNTEASWGTLTTAVGQQQASWLMRYHIAQAAAGVTRFVWYAYDSCSWGSLWTSPYCVNPLNTAGQLTDAGVAYPVVENWLSGANLINCKSYVNGLWACELQRSGNYDAWVLWSSTGTSISVPVPRTFGLAVYRDWKNNVNTLPTELTVTNMPVLLENHDL